MLRADRVSGETGPAALVLGLGVFFAGVRLRRWRLSSFATALVACMVALGAWGFSSGWGATSPAGGETPFGLCGAVGGPSSSGGLGDGLVVPAMQALDCGEQEADGARARRVGAAAFVLRLRSRTKFEHLGAAAAARVVREAFPELIDKAAVGPPALPSGGRLVRYISPSAAQVALPGGHHGVVEADGVIAKKLAPGEYVPLDLSLKHSGEGFAPVLAAASVGIPQQLGAGVTLASTGVSLTPVGADGSPLSGSPALEDGAVALYANVASDTDMLVKPAAAGFDLDAVLRSALSPSTFVFRVGMPAGARLVKDTAGNLARVVAGRAVVATITAG